MSSNTKLVLKYLKTNDCLQSFLTLQRQTGVSLISYSKEIDFFKKILLKGDFNQAVVFLQTFENRIQQGQFKIIMLQIYRQKLLELIENPNEQQLKNLFDKQLVAYCAEEQFQEMFSYLTYRSVNQIEGLEKWSIIRGRYYCFQSIVPILDMFNSKMKQEQSEDKLQDIVQFYNKNKFNQSEPFSFNRNNQIPQQQEVKTNDFTKNKSSVPQNFNKSNQLAKQQEEQPKLGSSMRSQNRDKEKEIIKNSVINMNISSNCSQMKSQLSNAGMIQKKSNRNQEENDVIGEKSKYNYSMIGKSQLNVQKSQLYIEKSSQFIEKSQNTNKNHINLQKSQQVSDKKLSSSIIQKSDIMNEKRPRTNANLKGSMNKQRIQGSIKIDNFMKNQSSASVQDNFNVSNAYRNAKIQKSQMVNENISNKYSQFNKSKAENKSNYSKLLENSLSSCHMNDFQSSHLNEIAQEDNSEDTKSVKNQKQKYRYLRQKEEDEDLSEQVKKNVEYLQQSNSVIWNNNSEISNQNFAFAGDQEQRNQKLEIKNITKLGTTSDSKAIRTCQFSQSGSYFAVGTNSSILKIFDIKNLFIKNKYQQITPIYLIDGIHTKSIFCLDWSKNQRSLATCSNDLNVKITEINKNFTEHKTSIIGKHESCIRMAKFSPSESKIISCGDDSLIKVWDTGKVKKCLNLKSHTSSVSAFKIQNQNQLFSVSKDMTIKKWDLRTGDNIFTSKIQESQLTYIANNTQKIVVSHKNGTISVFTQTLDLIHAVQIHQEQIRSVQALKGENLFLTASFDGHVAFFNQQNNHQPHYWQHNQDGDDKVVFATFLHSSHFKGFSSTSTQGLCHIYSYQ